MRRRYATADVFTNTQFEGNPLAVVLDAEGLSDRQMLRIAAEFGYAETTFVLPPASPENTARLRIFTPVREMPFAGHPNIGTAFVLAQQAAAKGTPFPNTITFEQIAGLISIRLLKDGPTVTGAELITPKSFASHSKVSTQSAAQCLSISPSNILTQAHEPQVVSVGMPFLIIELASRKALSECRPNRDGFDALLPLDGASAVFAYTRDVSDSKMPCDIEARMFTQRMTEDPATGGAAAAVSALLATVQGVSDLSLTVGQGTDIGRPSLLYTNVQTTNGGLYVRLGGHCVSMLEGALFMKGDDEV
jgi:trans-2,3-dihydro-3-hydroxyanthranilate isomerase